MSRSRSTELVAYLDEYLRVREVPDYAGAGTGCRWRTSGPDRPHRGGGGCVAGHDRRVVALLDRIDGDVGFSAHDRGSPLLLVHHGLFWDGNLPVTGRRYRRLRALLSHDIALYAAHLPLDAAPEVGNNAVLARVLGLEVQRQRSATTGGTRSASGARRRRPSPRGTRWRGQWPIGAGPRGLHRA